MPAEKRMTSLLRHHRRSTGVDIGYELAQALRLEVSVGYDMGLLPDSRGGSSSTWQLERRYGRWMLVHEAVTMHRD
jgi:hypothetical protein